MLTLLLLVMAPEAAAQPPDSQADPVAIKSPVVRSPPVVRIVPPPIVYPPAPPPPPSYTPLSPRGSPGNWVTPYDYPTDAIYNEIEGVTAFRLGVSADGRVSDCTITAGSGSSELDAATCKLLSRRARFNPGTENGVPFAGSYSNRIRWTITPDIFFLFDPDFEGPATYGAYLNEAGEGWTAAEQYPAAARKHGITGRTIVLLDIDAEGRVTGCTLDQPSGQPVLDKAACPSLNGKLIFEPGNDANDKPVADRVRVKLRWEPGAQ